MEVIGLSNCPVCGAMFDIELLAPSRERGRCPEGCVARASDCGATYYRILDKIFVFKHPMTQQRVEDLREAYWHAVQEAKLQRAGTVRWAA